MTFNLILQVTVECIRDLFLLTGWTRQGLPPGWLGKQDTKNYNFITPGATRVKNKKQVASHVPFYVDVDLYVSFAFPFSLMPAIQIQTPPSSRQLRSC